LTKEAKEWKDKFFEMQSCVQRMKEERAVRHIDIENLEVRCLELEGIVGKFASI